MRMEIGMSLSCQKGKDMDEYEMIKPVIYRWMFWGRLRYILSRIRMKWKAYLNRRHWNDVNNTEAYDRLRRKSVLIQ